MDLWIRSQDREDLVKVDNISIRHEYEQKIVNDDFGRISARKGNYKKTIFYSNDVWLGEYYSKEKALKILDEIQNALFGNIKYDYSVPPTLSSITTNLIYEMPQE